MKEVTVTGASGLAGAHLVLRLAEKGYGVLALAGSAGGIENAEAIFASYGTSRSALKQVQWLTGDIGDYHWLLEQFKGKDAVFHCAGLVSFHKEDQDKLFKINTEGTAQVVNACLESGVSKLNYISSVAALGKKPQGTFITENTPFVHNHTVSAYGLSKYQAENEVWRGAEEGLDVLVVNPSVILGPGDWLKGSSRMFKTAYYGLTFYATGASGFVDVRDVANIMIELYEKNISHERFILNSENISYRELFRMMCTAFGKKPPGIAATRWMGSLVWRAEKILSLLTGVKPLITKETADSAFSIVAYDTSKLKKLLNYQFIPVSQSIEDTVRHYSKRFQLA